MSRFLLRDGNPIGADISPAGLDVFTYEDAKGRAIHALASMKSEKELLSRIPAKLLPLYVRMEMSAAKSIERSSPWLKAAS